MIYHLLFCLITLVLDVFASVRIAPTEKDLQIALLRQQLRILERNSQTRQRLSRPEKLMLVTLAARLKTQTRRFHESLDEALLLVQPDTVLKWHRQLVRRKWTFQHPHRGGRPMLEPEIELLIVRIARENPRMGYDKIQGELLKLGFKVHPSIVKNVLHRHHLLPAPQRRPSSWRTFLKHHREQMLACDFFTVETLRLETLYVLFFIELGSRRVHLAGCTTNPDRAWVTQQARQLVWHLNDGGQTSLRFLIHDRDSKFPGSFEQVFVSEGFEIILTPFRAPKANAVAERWVRTIRQECLDQLLILNQRHLARVLKEYVHYYNAARPHQGLDQQTPIPLSRSRRGTIHCRDVLGGILHDYYRDAA
jgi:putative transposase